LVPTDYLKTINKDQFLDFFSEEENKAISLIKKQLLAKIRHDKLFTYKKTFKKENQRIKLIKEIYETEKDYVKCLKEFYDLYYAPLISKVHEDSKKVILDEKEMDKLFSNFIEIYKLNTKFLKMLEKEYKDYPFTQFAKIFKEAKESFKIYSVFINNYDNSFENYQLYLKKKKNFQDLIETCLLQTEQSKIIIKHSI
jgi:hypothetical protein